MHNLWMDNHNIRVFYLNVYYVNHVIFFFELIYPYTIQILVSIINYNNLLLELDRWNCSVDRSRFASAHFNLFNWV